MTDRLTTPALPPLEDPTAETYWRGTLEHRLMVQCCRRCSAHQFYPRPFCLGCDSADLVWVEAAGRGTVYSKVRVHIDVGQAIPPPYPVVLVDLDEGPRLLGRVLGAEPAIGARVRVAWEERAGLPPVPIFEVAP